MVHVDEKAALSERIFAWFGDKTRDELLVEIDRIITTDKPALAALWERLDRYQIALEKIRMLTVEVGDSVEAATIACDVAMEALRVN